MRKSALYLLASMAAALSTPVLAQDAAMATNAVRADPLPKLTVDQALAAETHPMAKRVLELIKIMEATVVEGKKPGFSEASWVPFAARVDTKNFRRVGNYGEIVNWNQYVTLLTGWARTSWYTGRVRRIREAGNLVYLETEERSSTTGPFGEDGGYSSFNSNAVYEFGPDGKLTGLWIYDQMLHKGTK